MPNFAAAFNPPAAVAEVTITVPATRQSVGGISMLLDTGADVTLLPRRVVDQLQPPGISTIRLQAFDGAILDRPAYDLIVGFQNGNFRDDFGITDMEVGVLGRNILNHFRLLLDGPAQEWSVE